MTTKTRRVQRTFHPTPKDVQNDWVLIDAADQTLGRLATEVARRIRGKRKPDFTPSVDTGDFVIVINAEKIKVTGNKEEDKYYYSHSQYPGGLKKVQYKAQMKKDPRKVICHAVHGMLPHNRMGNQLRTRVKVYIRSEHPHESQQPKVIEV